MENVAGEDNRDSSYSRSLAVTIKLNEIFTNSHVIKNIFDMLRATVLNISDLCHFAFKF